MFYFLNKNVGFGNGEEKIEIVPWRNAISSHPAVVNAGEKLGINFGSCDLSFLKNNNCICTSLKKGIMKNCSIVLFAFMFVLSMGLSSCSKKGCGGWYGDKHLGYVPVKKTPVDSVNPFILSEEDSECEISNP